MCNGTLIYIKCSGGVSLSAFKCSELTIFANTIEHQASSAELQTLQLRPFCTRLQPRMPAQCLFGRLFKKNLSQRGCLSRLIQTHTHTHTFICDSCVSSAAPSLKNPSLRARNPSWQSEANSKLKVDAFRYSELGTSEWLLGAKRGGQRHLFPTKKSMYHYQCASYVEPF